MELISHRGHSGHRVKFARFRSFDKLENHPGVNTSFIDAPWLPEVEIGDELWVT